MPTNVPYVVSIKETITANGTLEFTFKAPNNQPVTLYDAHFKSTAAFSIIRMQTDDGRQYTNASTADPILSTELPSDGTDVRTVELFKVPLLLDAGKTLTVELLDTSGSSNEVNMYFCGQMEYQ